MLKLKDTYNAIAEDWAATYAADTWWIEGTKQFAKLLKPGASVLDVGCGVGDKTQFLAEQGLQACGLDFSEKMVEVAKSRFQHLSFSQQDIYQLTLPDNSVDGIFLQAVLLHVPKRQVPQVLKGLNRVLKPGGLIYVAVKELQPGQPDEVTRKEIVRGVEYERFFSNFTQPELQSLLSDAGLQTIVTNVLPSRTSSWLQYIAQKA